MRTNWPDERIHRELAARDPARDVLVVETEHAAEAAELLRRILRSDAAACAADDDGSLVGLAQGLGARKPWRRWAQRAWWRPVLVLGLALLALLAALGPLSSSGSELSGPTRTPLRAAEPFHRAVTASTNRSGTWRLLGAVLNGKWQQNVEGPPPGTLTCAATNACYVLAGRYASAAVGSPLLSESLYATNDLGATWDVLPMPSGFSSTTALTCWAASACTAGGTLHGQPIFISTTDGGRQWTMVPLLGVPGVLLRLACFSSQRCAGISGPSWAQQVVGVPNAPPGESFVTTVDGGRSWHANPLLPADAVTGFTCINAERCLLMGKQWTRTGTPFREVDFVRSTADGGRSWASGALPKGFVLGPASGLSCADASHCFVTGMIPITNANSSRCAAAHLPPSPAASDTLPAMGPAVAALSKMESVAAARASATESRSGVFGCTNARVEQVSDIASSSDGGLTWTPDALPGDVPYPQLDSIACASATQCWASGSEQILERVGRGENMSSPVLLGTTDGGATWSKVVFSVPAGAPDAYGQSYLSIGDISCPATTACIALGGAAQSAPTAPAYSVVTATGVLGKEPGTIRHAGP